jgi:hypothetical protein
MIVNRIGFYSGGFDARAKRGAAHAPGGGYRNHPLYSKTKIPVFK